MSVTVSCLGGRFCVKYWASKCAEVFLGASCWNDHQRCSFLFVSHDLLPRERYIFELKTMMLLTKHIQASQVKLDPKKCLSLT